MSEERDDRNDRKKQAELARQTELADLCAVLATVTGERVLRRIIAEAGVFRQSYTGEPNGTAFNEGRRGMGLWLLAELAEAAPNAYHSTLLGGKK